MTAVKQSLALQNDLSQDSRSGTLAPLSLTTAGDDLVKGKSLVGASVRLHDEDGIDPRHALVNKGLTLRPSASNLDGYG